MKSLKKFFSAITAAFWVLISPDQYAEIMKPKRELDEDPQVTTLRGTF